MEIPDLRAAVNIRPGSPAVGGADRPSCRSNENVELQMNALTMWRQLPWVARFPIAATTATVILLPLIWTLAGFGWLRLDATATVGAMLGIVFAIALAVALMTLIFYSNRSGMDDLVAEAGEPGVQNGEDGSSDGEVEQRTR
jgi:hypothetical protein